LIILARGILTMNFIFLIINITGTHIHKYPGDMFFWFFNGVLLNMHDGPSAVSQLSGSLQDGVTGPA
jgi:hypothetical protein